MSLHLIGKFDWIPWPIYTNLYIYRLEYEDELIDRIIIPHLIPVINDPDVVVRTAVANLLIEQCLYCESKRCLELLDILEKVLLFWNC